MTVLTRFDPVAYGMAPIREAALSGAGLPAGALDRYTGITIAGHTLSPIADIGILLLLGVAFLVVSMRVLRRRD
jgi:hypothetical protein